VNLSRGEWYKVQPDLKDAHLAKDDWQFYCGRAIWEGSGRCIPHTVDSGRCGFCKAERRKADEQASYDAAYKRQALPKGHADIPAEKFNEWSKGKHIPQSTVDIIAAQVCAWFDGEVIHV